MTGQPSRPRDAARAARAAREARVVTRAPWLPWAGLGGIRGMAARLRAEGERLDDPPEGRDRRIVQPERGGPPVGAPNPPVL